MKFTRFVKSAFVAIAVTLGLLSTSMAIAAASHSGQFTAAFTSWGKSSLQGSWSIEQQGEKWVLKLGDDFKAKSAPDIKVFLSPKNASAINGKNATEGSLLVQKINQFSGEVIIELPAGTQLKDYQTLVLHCEEYGKLWGTSPL